MVKIPLLKRHWGSWVRGSVASWMNQLGNKPKDQEPKAKKEPLGLKLSLKYNLYIYVSRTKVTSFNDIMIICFLLRVGKALHMCSRVMPTGLHIHQHPQPILPISYAQTIAECHNPLSMHVTLSPRYFRAPSYQSLKFIKKTISHKDCKQMK